MRIIFLRAYDFPIGGAPQNRLLGFCIGLQNQGVDVEVCQYAPAKNSIPANLLKAQVYKGVRIKNFSYRFSPVKSKVYQLLGIGEGISRTIAYLISSNRTKKIDFVVFNTENLIFTSLFYFICRVLKIKTGRDLNEYPLHLIKKPSKFGSIWKNFRLSIDYKWFNFVFVISTSLFDYYKPLIKKEAKVLLIPINVDFNRFPTIVSSLSNNHFISYCGDLSQSKDGVADLIKSFSLIHKTFPDKILKLIGRTTEKNLISLKTLVEEVNLTDKVIFTGYVNPEEIPNHLYESRLLVLARPDNIQAKGGFPTKLGEYLATGVPVVVTNVGDLGNYIMNGYSGYLAQPGDPSIFANKMMEALSDDQKSSEIGRNGREMAKEHFSVLVQGEQLYNFLNSI